MNKFNNRIKQYCSISTSLACFSNERLLSLFAQAKPMHKGIGGTSVLISIDETLVFVKKVPLTDLEQGPHNFMSTANIFDLPLFYQYGVGSAGFGAWRELATHIMTSNWVISDKCPNFPIMYHWRILPNNESDLNIEHWKNIENYIKYWDNSKAICNRIEKLNQATWNIALFLEYIPQNLQEWLSNKLIKDDKTAEIAVKFVDHNLKITNRFMNTHGLIHFDAHFKNILTDGELLYFSDFGLALSSKFELTKAEIEFFNRHQNYDQCCAAINLLHCIITSIFGREQWEIKLKEYLEDKNQIENATRAIVKKYAPVALLMDDFFQKLQNISKSTTYPSACLEKQKV